MLIDSAGHECYTLCKHYYSIFLLLAKANLYSLMITEFLMLAFTNSKQAEGILADFLMKNKAEVLRMSLFEYDQEKHLQQEREEAEARGEVRGEARGIELGRLEQARAMAEELFKSGIPMETIAQAAKVNMEVVQNWLEKA